MIIRHKSKWVLPDSKHLFHHIIETIAEGLWVLDPDGQTTFVNSQMLAMLGYAVNEMHGKSLLKFVSKGYQATAAVILERCHQGIIQQHHLKFRHRDSSNLWATLSASPIFSQEGQYTGTLGVVTDLTYLENTEAALRKQAQREQALNRVTQAIRSSLDLNTIFSTAAFEIGKLLEADYVQIVQYLPERQLWLNVAEYRRHLDWPTTLGTEVSDQDNKIATKIKHLEIVRLDEVRTCKNKSNRHSAQFTPSSRLLVPLHFHSVVWGSLSLRRSQAHDWQNADIEMLRSVADQLSVAIHQAELYQQLEDANQNLQRLAYLDSLTQLVNRRRFDECLEKEWRRLAREKAPLSDYV